MRFTGRTCLVLALSAGVSTALHAATIYTGPQGSGWVSYLPHSSLFAGITSANQRNGHDTLEMRQTQFGSPAWFFEPTPGPLGLWGDLNSFSAYYYSPTDGANPGFALRIYDWQDPRGYWVSFRPSATGGAWQSTGNMLLQPLMIHPAGSNSIPPPATLAGIPDDAPVHGIHLWAPWPERDWTGFYDEVRLQFGQLDPDPGPGGDPAPIPEPAASALLSAGLGLLALHHRLRRR